jgi:DNA repair exonuclease SbcCD nuclease subunit
MTKNNPLFVMINDVHFSVQNLHTASRALITACQHAEKLKVPLVIAGDLNDTKAIIRAEVANQLISIMKYSTCTKYILVGNHDLVNEKSSEHSLNFLEPYATIVDSPKVHPGLPEVFMIPYQSDAEKLLLLLKAPRTEKIYVMHQGFKGAFMGDYSVDKTSIDVSAVEHVRVFSGHYHRHQTIGTVTYSGNPYTLTFGEANDGPKGFIVVNEDGSYEHVPLKLRRHIKLEIEVTGNSLMVPVHDATEEDYVWLKLTGAKSVLDKITKKEMSNYFGHENFKLDKIYLDSVESSKNMSKMKDEEVLDAIINSTPEGEAVKLYLKNLWREVMYENSSI